MDYLSLLPKEINNYILNLHRLNNPNNQFISSLHLIFHHYLPKTRLERFFRKQNWKVLVNKNKLIVFDLPLISNKVLVKFLLKLSSDENEMDLINLILEKFKIRYRIVCTGVIKV